MSRVEGLLVDSKGFGKALESPEQKQDIIWSVFQVLLLLVSENRLQVDNA
jgi:hypothetical protein